MKFIYSQLSSDSVSEYLMSYYEFGASINSKFYVQGLHDNYLIESNSVKYIFRIYRNTWRTEEEILFELDVLSHLEKKSSNVAAPIRTRNNEVVIHIKFPEGVRLGVLFQYAEGCPPINDISIDECRLLGVSVANIHNNTDEFRSKYKREVLDLECLVDDSLKLIKPFLDKSQIDYLCKIKEKIYTNIYFMTVDNSDFGICVGDINPTNFHITKDQVITHFDFDQCGYGFRAFEIGKFTACLQSHPSKSDKVDSFVDGYESVRKISAQEKKSIPYFEVIAIIWVMSIHVSNVSKIGYKYLDQRFWEKRIGSIEKLVADWV